MGTSDLTRREKEVSELVAQGLTNREIAVRLFISERTAESHVEQIRSKLGFHSRAQIAAWVVAGRSSAATATAPAPNLAADTPATSPPRRRLAVGSRTGLVVGSSAAVVAVALVVVAVVFASGWPGMPAAATPTISTLAGTGQSAFSNDGAMASNTALIHPVAVALGHDGEVYIAEGNRIRLVDRNGRMRTLAGTGTAGDGGEDGPAVHAQLNQPQGLAVDSAGNVYIADTLNHRVLRVGLDGVITRAAGSGQAGSSGDGGPARDAKLNLPTGLAIGFADAVYIADTGSNVVRELGSDGTIRTVAGTGEAGYRGDAGPALFALLDAPAGLAFDAEGNLYVADTINNRVRRVDVNGVIDTVGGTGVVGFAGDGGPATSAELDLASNPLEGVGDGLAVDSRGNLFIADAGNHRVRRVDVHGTITTIAGGSTSGDGGDGGPAASALLRTPVAVAVDAVGTVYVADGDDNRVRRIA